MVKYRILQPAWHDEDRHAHYRKNGEMYEKKPSGKTFSYRMRHKGAEEKAFMQSKQKYGTVVSKDGDGKKRMDIPFCP